MPVPSHLYSKKIVSWCSEETPSVCAPLPLSCHWVQLKGSWLCLYTLPWANCIWYWGIDQIPLRPLFPKLKRPSSLSLSLQEGSFSPFIIFMTSLTCLQYVHHCIEEPRTGHNTWTVSSPGLSRREGSPPSPCCPVLAQDLCCKGALLAYSHIVAYLFCQTVFQVIGFQMVDIQHILVHFLLNFMRFLSGHFSRLMRSVWVAAWSFGTSSTSPSFVSLATLQNERSALSFRPSVL